MAKTGCTKLNARILITFLTLILVFALSLANYSLVLQPVETFISGKADTETTIKTITENYRSDLFEGKDLCITMNGLFARLSGRRVYNDVTLMKNGSLTGTVSNRESTITTLSDESILVNFYSYFKKTNTPFLFIQRPFNTPLQEDLLPDGTFNIDQERGLRYVQAMKEAGAATLSLAPLMANTTEDINRNFYRTDHHWNSDGALLAYGYILDEMENVLGTTLDKSSADPENWERHELQNWWLGSRGKRVGPLFAGTDSLIWHTPKFETGRISRATAEKNTFYTGDFSEACLRIGVTQKRNYYHSNDYYVYLGGDAALVQLRNEQAPNKKKVLVIKNSFGIPILAYLSTAFTEVDALDPRYYNESSLFQYIAWTKPDIVISLISAGHLESDCLNADPDGSAQLAWNAEQRTPTEVFSMEQCVVKPEKKSKTILFEAVEQGEVYRLNIDQVSVDCKDPGGLRVALKESKSKKIVSSIIFDIDYCNRHGFQWTFCVPGSRNGDSKTEYQVLIYKENYTGNDDAEVICKGITLCKE